MSDTIESLREEFRDRPTEELISILRNRDEEEWRAEVFDVVAAELRARGVSPEEVVALGPEGRDVVEAEPTVTIATFFSPAEAHGSRMALEEAGIPAWVADETLGTMFGVGVGSRVQVRIKDVQAAREILSSPPATGAELPPDLAEPACPACGSQNVAPEAWLNEVESDEPRRRRMRRKWYYVCGDCREAWPL